MGKIILNGIEYIGGEADNVFAPVIYSDNERVIGVWRDNKPLYQKTYHFNSLVTLNSNTWFDTGFKISDSVIVGNSVAFRDDNIAGQSFPVIASADIGTNQAIELLQTRNSSIAISGFTIQYTKTTDTAGSGNWNVDGVPTVHYDTNEQVIGTWLGKPLYQRTWDFISTNIINANTWTNLFSNDIDIDKVTMNETLDDEGRSNKVAYCGVRNGYIAVYSTYATNIQTITLRYTKTTD